MPNTTTSKLKAWLCHVSEPGPVNDRALRRGVRAARRARGWGVPDLVAASAVPAAKVRWFEAGLPTRRADLLAIASAVDVAVFHGHEGQPRWKVCAAAAFIILFPLTAFGFLLGRVSWRPRLVVAAVVLLVLAALEVQVTEAFRSGNGNAPAVLAVVVVQAFLLAAAAQVAAGFLLNLAFSSASARVGTAAAAACVALALLSPVPIRNTQAMLLENAAARDAVVKETLAGLAETDRMYGAGSTQAASVSAEQIRAALEELPHPTLAGALSRMLFGG